LLDLPKVLAERVLHEHSAPQPQLVTTGTVSRPRYLFERYSGSALYLILTGVIVVPAVLMAMRAGFDQNLVRITALDTPELTATPQPRDDAAIEAKSATVVDVGADAPKPKPVAAETAQPPLIASMAPFPAPAADHDKPETPVPAGSHSMRLSLTEASWVEIVAADGQKLEYGLLAAGSSHSYASAKALDVRIGNANGATLEVDGKPADIGLYRHSNVAHFKLAEGALTHSGG